MKSTTPLLLSSMSLFSVVLSPVWVSISPPKPSRFMVTPTANLVAAEEEPLRVAAFFSGTLPLALEVEELLFFSGGVAVGSTAGALRLRNSTIVII